MSKSVIAAVIQNLLSKPNFNSEDLRQNLNFYFEAGGRTLHLDFRGKYSTSIEILESPVKCNVTLTDVQTPKFVFTQTEGTVSLLRCSIGEVTVDSQTLSKLTVNDSIATSLNIAAISATSNGITIAGDHNVITNLKISNCHLGNSVINTKNSYLTIDNSIITYDPGGLGLNQMAFWGCEVATFSSCEFLGEKISFSMNKFGDKCSFLFSECTFPQTTFAFGGKNLNLDLVNCAGYHPIKIQESASASIFRIKKTAEPKEKNPFPLVLNIVGSLALFEATGANIGKLHIRDSSKKDSLIAFFHSTDSSFETISLEQKGFKTIQLVETKVKYFLSRECEIRSALKLMRCEIEEFQFEETNLVGRNDFPETIFQIAPNFVSCSLSSDSSFLNAYFPDIASPSAKARYRTLKSHMAENSDELGRMFFSALEHDCRRIEMAWCSKDFFEKLLSCGYKMTNNYGRNLYWPLVYWLLLFALMLPFYKSNELEVIPFKDSKETWIHKLKGSQELSSVLTEPVLTTQALVFSALNAMGPIRLLPNANFIVPKSLFVQIIAFAHGVISTILLFLFIANIKRRLSISN